MELVVRRLELVPSIVSVPGRIMDRDVKVSVPCHMFYYYFLCNVPTLIESAMLFSNVLLVAYLEFCLAFSCVQLLTK